MRVRTRALQALTRTSLPRWRLSAVLILALHLLCTRTVASEHTPSFRDTASLVRRVRHLRHRLQAIRKTRRELDQQRDLLERSIADARSRLEQLSPAAVLSDNSVAFTGAGTGLDTGRALIADYRARREELDRHLAVLAVEAQQLGSERVDAVARLQSVSLPDLVARQASALPPAMRGALRKGAAVLTPVFHSLFTVADSNDRLVQHVGAEIDRYTHFGVGSSPFMSGMLFYCVLLIPTLTLIVLVRAVADSSPKISPSHCIVAASSYIVVTCLVFVLAATFTSDPMKVLYARHERALVASNLALAAYYVWFICVLAAETMHSWDTRNSAQLSAALAVAIHYFIFAWRRIFTDKPPQLLAFNYLIYATIFAFIAYDRCMRINPRWITESPVFTFFHSLDSPITYASVMTALNRNHLRNVQRTIINFCSQCAQSLLATLHRLRRTPRSRRRRRNRSTRERADSPPSPVRATATTGKGVIGLSLSRARRCAMYTRVADASDGSTVSDSSCSDTDPDEPAAEPLLSRTSARAAAAAAAGARALLASRSRSRSGSVGNDSPDEARGWWWSRRNIDNDTIEPQRQGNTRGRGAASRASPHRSNARPRKEREQYNSGYARSTFSLWKWS